MAIVSRPLTERVGVEVDVDPTREFSDDERDELRSLFFDRHLVVVRGHELTVEEQVRFCSIFGVVVGADATPESYISNQRDDGILGVELLLWHSDMSFDEVPHLGASLYGEIVAAGVPTRFANCEIVETLSLGLRAALAGRSVVHQYPYEPGRPPPNLADLPVWVHPVILRHPITGREVIYTNEMQVAVGNGFVDGDEADNRRVLDELFSVLYADDNVYEHEWREHDLVIWDNLALQHARRPVVGRRQLRRLALVADAADAGTYLAAQNQERAYGRG